MDNQVISRDDHIVDIPSEYSRDSKFFERRQLYRSNQVLGYSDIAEVPFYYEQLLLTTYPIDVLDHNQLLDVLPVEQYFANDKRLHQVELSIVRQWVNGFYLNVSAEEYDDLRQLVIDIIYNNDSCAAYIYINNLHEGYDNIKLSPLDNVLFWCKIDSNLMNIIDYKNIDQLYSFINKKNINDRPSSRDWVNLFIRLDQPLNEYLDRTDMLGDIATYYELINNRPTHSSSYTTGLLSLIRYEDVDLGCWNLLYQHMIIRNRPSLPLLDNPDIRVIERILSVTGLSFDGILTTSELDHYYINGNPAAVKILNLNRTRLIRDTDRLDTFLSVIDDNSRITYYNDDNRTKIYWYSFIHNIDMVTEEGDDDYIINDIVMNITDWTWLCSILNYPDKIELIPVMMVYSLDKKLAHILAELGGNILLSDIVIDGLTDDEVNFILAYGYRLTDPKDIEEVNNHLQYYPISRRLQRLIDTADPRTIVTSNHQPNMRVIKAIPIRPRSYIEKFSGDIPMSAWLDIALGIDQYMAGQTDLQIIANIFNNRDRDSVGSIIEAIRSYIIHYTPDQVNELTEEEDRLLR